MTRLLRSLIVAARRFAPLSFQGFRHSARLGRISPPGWSLLPGAPALTRTGLPPARTTRLSGRTMTRHLIMSSRQASQCAVLGHKRNLKTGADKSITCGHRPGGARQPVLSMVTGRSRKWPSSFPNRSGPKQPSRKYGFATERDSSGRLRERRFPRM
jgi:hypothetical protein